MVSCGCWRWGSKKIVETSDSRPQIHSAGLPAPLPSWPPGTGFASGKFSLGEDLVEIAKVSTFEEVWRSVGGPGGAIFLKPIDLPPGFHCLGHYAQAMDSPAQGWVLAIRGSLSTSGIKAPLAKPMDFSLVWSSLALDGQEERDLGFFWRPLPPPGYRPVGYVVTKSGEKPSLNEVVCVRSDLTEECLVDELLWDTSNFVKVPPFVAGTTKPLLSGMHQKGISSGTFYCHSSLATESPLPMSCLKNVDFRLDLMPNLEQIRKIMSCYGPTVFFHPNEEHFPSSVRWFFDQGALLHTAGSTSRPVKIYSDGSNLPMGGCNDKRFWLDFPNDRSGEEVQKGNLASAVTYVHVKPMFGGTFTDLVCWLYYTYRGSSTTKLGILKSVPLGKIGQQVSEWEHFTLRVDNFTGELREIYYPQHNGCGKWLKPNKLEIIAENRAVVYSSKSNHGNYPHEGENLEGDERLGIGIRHDTCRSKFCLDTSLKYELMSVEFLKGKGESRWPSEPPWLQYMREWGPKVEYDSRAELEKVLKRLPSMIRKPLREFLKDLPNELGAEEKRPTGPRSRANWSDDEA